MSEGRAMNDVPDGESSVPETEIVCEPGKLPYVRGGKPGTWNLSNEMIAEIFDEEDMAKIEPS
jgi:hypothetical protein